MAEQCVTFKVLVVGAAGVYVEGNTGEEPGAEESGWIIKKPAGLIERDAYDELGKWGLHYPQLNNDLHTNTCSWGR